MKLLLAGNDGFLSKKLAERALAEKNKVYCVGDFEADLPTQIRFFHFSPQKPEICEVFNTYNPDMVVFISNVKEDIRGDIRERDVSEHVSAFFNIFSLADLYKIPRFIYISTADLYDNQEEAANEESILKANTKRQETHLICEQHILNSINKVNQKTLILRLSTLYDENPDDPGNILDYLLFHDADTNRKRGMLQLRKKYDLLHSDDFSSAVMLLQDFKKDDAINIGSGKLILRKDIENMVNVYAGGMEYQGEIPFEYGMDVEKASESYGFKVRKGTKKSIKEAIAAKVDKRNEKKKKLSLGQKIKNFFELDFFKSKAFKTILNYLENLVLFGIVLLLTDFFKNSFLNEYIDIRVAYIALMGLVHGLRQSSVSAALCIATVLINYEMSDYGLITVVYDINVLIMILIFITVAMITGNIRQRFNNQNEELEDALERTQDQLDYTRSMYKESIAVKDSLQFQVLNATDSYGRIFSSVEKLDSLHFDKLKTELIIVAQEIMRNDSIALYMMGRNTRFSRLISYSHKLAHMPKSVEIISRPEFNKVYQSHEMFVNRDVSNTKAPMMLAPIVDDNRVIAMLALYDAPLEVLTLSYENLFRITARLVSQAIIRAYSYREALEDKWYINDTQVLTAESFSEKLIHAQEASSNEQASFVLLRVDENSHKLLFESSSKYVREFDYVGMGKNGEMFLLLNNVSRQDLPFIQKRFGENGIKTIIVKEVYNI